jgi:hypothetical protein
MECTGSVRVRRGFRAYSSEPAADDTAARAAAIACDHPGLPPIHTRVPVHLLAAPWWALAVSLRVWATLTATSQRPASLAHLSSGARVQGKAWFLVIPVACQDAHPEKHCDDTEREAVFDWVVTQGPHVSVAVLNSPKLATKDLEMEPVAAPLRQQHVQERLRASRTQ